MDFLTLLVAGTVTVLIGLAQNMLAADLYDRCPAIARWIITKAASLLSEDQRERYNEEWLAHLLECPSKIAQLIHAIQCFRGALTIRLREKDNFKGARASTKVGEELLRAAEEITRLTSAIRMNEDLVHHVSYELRSPLTNIVGFAHLLGTEAIGELNEKQRDYTSHILRSSGALLAIVNDILDLASVDNGELTLELGAIDVREIIDQAVLGLTDRLSEANVRLVINVAPDIGQLHADGRRLRQVVFNLLSNAIGFSEAGQSVHVLAMRHGNDVMLTVTDEGRGIPPEVKAKVFDRFESHALGSRHRGVGLGLSIVRSLIELHGGRVELESAPGQGTRVTCTLPVKGTAISVAA